MHTVGLPFNTCKSSVGASRMFNLGESVFFTLALKFSDQWPNCHLKILIVDDSRPVKCTMTANQGANLTVSRSKMLHILDILLHKFQLV